ncbi:MAG: GDP-mannose 4,6-dehydratase [Bacteroidetes bacterium]|nr:GDP-mannose 4,6-dehydratase [Bacteroidota bacterium]
MNALVTGAAGYIGSLLSKKILEAGHNLRFYDLITAYIPELETIVNNPHCKTYYGDLRETGIIVEALKDCDVVIHLAGISDGRMGKKNPELTKELIQGILFFNRKNK